MERSAQDRLARSLGPLVAEDFAPEIAEGFDIRPTIAVTKARLDMPEMQDAMRAGR